MKVAVCIKEVVDSRMPLQVLRGRDQVSQPNGGGDPVRLINPADRSALEVGMGIRERLPGVRLHGLSTCDGSREGPLFFARARGADTVERVVPPQEQRGPPATAITLASRLREGDYDLVICGDRTLDNSAAMVGPLVAELLEIPSVTSVSKIRERHPDHLVVERRLERGYRQVVEVSFPALITTTEDAARPPYVSHKRLHHARREPIPASEVDWNGGSRRVPQWPEDERMKPPRARVKNKSAPDANRAASDRLKMMMGDLGSEGSGGSSAKGSEDVSILDGDPEYLGEQLYRFLRHHGFV